MPPDLNSLPPSPSPSTPRTSTSNNPSPPILSIPTTTSPTTAAMSTSPPISHTPPHSLAAAATMNAGIQNEDRRHSGGMRRDVERARRRSSIRMNLNLNDPGLPAPGEMQRSPTSWSSRVGGGLPHSPHHERTPSLGELHQELEYEQEGQVNRLLNMIRQQQTQIQALQTNTNHDNSAVDDSTPTSERSTSIPPNNRQNQQNVSPHPSSATSPFPPAALPHRSNSPFAPMPPRGTMSRQSSLADRSRGSSHAGSPALRPISTHENSYDFLPASTLSLQTRDESAFYQAETQMLTRENQMLKLRIRELERQLADSTPHSATTRSPILSSNLHSSPPISRRTTENLETAPNGN